MPRRVAQNVSLTPEHAAFIAAQVVSGRYSSVSEVVRAALNSLAQREGGSAARRQVDTGADRG